MKRRPSSLGALAPLLALAGFAGLSNTSLYTVPTYGERNEPGTGLDSVDAYGKRYAHTPMGIRRLDRKPWINKAQMKAYKRMRRLAREAAAVS